MDEYEFRDARSKVLGKVAVVLCINAALLWRLATTYDFVFSGVSLAIAVVLSVLIAMKLYFSRDKLHCPPYAIRNGFLYINYGGGEVDEYPLSWFGGSVVEKTIFFEPYLAAPGYRRYSGNIPIGFVSSHERRNLIGRLKILVENA